MFTTKKDYSYVGIVYSVMTVSVILAQYAIIMLIRNIPEISGNYSLSTLITTLIFYIVGFAILYFSMIKPNKALPKIQKNKLSTKRFFSFFFMAYFLMIVGNIIGLIFTAIVGSLRQADVSNVLVDTLTTLNPLVSFFLVVICAPIFEELFFRKYILDRLHSHGNIPAILISGLMFGFFHANANQFFYTFILGIIFAYIYLNYGDIKICIAMHALINLIGFIVATLLSGIDLTMLEELSNIDAADPTNTDMILEYFASFVPILIFELFILGFIITGFILLIKNMKTFKAYIAYSKPTQNIKTKDAIFNIGICLFMIICLAQIILQLFL